MRKMYDSVTPTGCPADGQLLAGYVDGNYPSYFTMLGLANGRRVVSITVHGAAAMMCDVESGAMTPMEAAQWVQQRRALGFTPTVYCSLSNVPAVLADCRAIGVTLPVQFGVAAWDGSPTFPPAPSGAVFMSKQYLHDLHDRGLNYDVSSVVDYWPGVDDGLDPLGGGTLLGGFLDTLTAAEQQEVLAAARFINSRAAKLESAAGAVITSILPAVADIRPNADMIPQLAASITSLAKQIAQIQPSPGGLTQGDIQLALRQFFQQLGIVSTVTTTLTQGA